jgi:hypothetical protein
MEDPRDVIVMLSKQGVNFINILCARFSYENALRSFFPVHFGFFLFGKRILAKKARAHVKC